MKDITPILVRLINATPRAKFMNVEFEELRTLFETDPVAAEQRVAEIFDEYISSLDADKQQRARAYNWRIQQELRKHKDPIARLNCMVEMFWEGVKDFQSALEGKHPAQILDQNGQPSPVVKFPKK